MTEFDRGPKKDGWSLEDIAQLPFKVDPSDLNRDMSAFYRLGAAADLIDKISENPEQFSFGQLKSISDYFKKENLPRRFPGAAYTQTFYKTDPHPICSIDENPIHLNHRFIITHSNYDKNVLIDACLSPDSIELPDGLTLSKDHRLFKIEDSQLIFWPLRLSPGNEVTLGKALLDVSRIEFHFGHGPGSGFIRSLGPIRIGTASSLGIINFPHKILATTDIPSNADAIEGLKSITGTWLDSIETFCDQDLIKLSFVRNGNFWGAHHSLTIKNDGNIPVIIRFSDPTLISR